MVSAIGSAGGLKFNQGLFWCAALGSVLFACDGSTGGLGGQAQLSVDLSRVYLGPILVGEAFEQTLAVDNLGDEPLVIGRLSTNNDAITAELDFEELPAGGRGALTLRFAPLEAGRFEGEVSILSNSALAEALIPVEGEAEVLALEFSPPRADFGGVVLEETATERVTLTNGNSIPLSLRLLLNGRIQRCPFREADKAFCMDYFEETLTLNPGASAAVDFRFLPQAIQVRERAEVTFSACGSGLCDKTLVLEGLGVDQSLACDHVELDFGSVEPGRCLTQTVSCENIGANTLVIEGWRALDASGEPSPDFEAEPSTTVVLDAEETARIDVSFCPAATGPHSGFLEIEKTDPQPQRRAIRVGLKGRGGGPALSLSSSRCDFGETSLIAPSRCSIWVQSAGLEPLEIQRLELDAPSGGFSLVNGAATVLAPGERTELIVEFLPTQTGAAVGTLQLFTNDQTQNPVDILLQGEGVDLAPCSFEAPTELNFGTVELGRSQARTLLIRNTGSEDCLASGFTGASSADFQFEQVSGSRRVPAGRALGLRLHFFAETLGERTGALSFSISSPTTPFNTVTVRGKAVSAALQTTVDRVDFGALELGCASDARALGIFNPTALAVELQSATLVDPDSGFSMQLQQSLPFTVLPGQRLPFEVRFAPSGPGTYAGYLELVAEWANNTERILVDLSGRSQFGAVQVDRFTQAGSTKQDVLMVIDNSAGMENEQIAIAANFESFIGYAEALGLDYRIGVVSTDVTNLAQAGRLQSEPISPTSIPSARAAFENAVTLGGDGSGLEQGLEAGRVALSGVQLSGANAGFLRPDTPLSVIYVSDEPDGSPSPVQIYLDTLTRLRPPGQLSVSAIVGPTPGGCTGPGGSAAPAPRYIELAQETDGTVEPVCTSDWSRSLNSVGRVAFGRKRVFRLTASPQGEPQVYVDGALLPANGQGGTEVWSVNEDRLRFAPLAVPEPGAEIEVRYTLSCQ